MSQTTKQHASEGEAEVSSGAFATPATLRRKFEIFF